MSESKKSSNAPKGKPKAPGSKPRVASEGASDVPLRGSRDTTERRSFSVGDSAAPTVKDVLKPRGGDSSKGKK